MNPVGFGNETDTLLRARRSQVYEDGLPVFSRDACPDVLFKILTVVNFLPSIALTKVQGVVVRERSEEKFSLIHDFPLLIVIRRRRVAAMTFVDKEGATKREKRWPTQEDTTRCCPQAIFVSPKCAVTMAFVE